MRTLRKAGKFILIFYVLLVTMLYFFQEKLIFLPTKLPQNYEYAFKRPFEEFNLTSTDSAILNAVHFKQDEPNGVILYFHGNAGDLSRWGDIVTFFVDKKYDVIVMDYRTYGKSTGKLSEEALHNDAQLFYDYTLQQYQENEITIYGRSLGTGIATKLASNNKPKRLILETPYYSLINVAKDRFPFLTVRWLLNYKFKSFQYIQQVISPVYIFHGTDDQVVPYTSGRRLFDVIPPTHEKKFHTINGGGHNNLKEFETYLKGIETILSVD